MNNEFIKPENLLIYLASSSPRRKKLLESTGFNVKIIKLNFDEKIKDDESAEEVALRISKEKMDAVLSSGKVGDKPGIVLTADTIVAIDDIILGKPESTNAAVAMLKMLSGKTHTVYTGFSLFNTSNKRLITEYEKTLVTFDNLNIDEIEYYVSTGSPMDKAGSYGIQDDFGAFFVKKIAGCFYNVVGLPLSKVYLNIKTIL